MKTDNFLKPSYLKERKLSKRVKNALGYWAREAHEIDPSRTIGFYYELFLKRINKQFTTSPEIKNFFGEKAIEN